MNIEIRQVNPGEEALLTRVRAGVFDRPVTQGLLSAYLARPGNVLILALVDGEVIGQCAATVQNHPDKPPELYVSEIAVAPNLRRRGVARRLIEGVFYAGKSLGCVTAWVVTNRGNDAARALFRDGAAKQEDALLHEYML